MTRCFFCLRSFYRLVFSFSAVRCGKAEEKGNGRQIGVTERVGAGWACGLGAPTCDCLVQFSSASLPAGAVAGVGLVECAAVDGGSVAASAGQRRGAGECECRGREVGGL